MISPVIENKFDYKGYECLVVFMPFGYRCGYVEIPKGHKLYRKQYDEMYFLDVHGGITFSNYNNFGGANDKWYVGFDCNHYRDKTDIEAMKKNGFERFVTPDSIFNYGTIRTMEFVDKELKELVDQIKEIQEK